MKKMWTWIKSHKVLTLLLILVVGGLFLFLTRSKGPEVEYITEIVKQEDLVQTVSVTGKVETEDQVDLKFNVPGDIEEILVRVGDVVIEGQELVKLTARDLDAALREAQAQVVSQEANLSKVLQGAKNEEIALAYARLQKAHNDYEALDVQLSAEESAVQTDMNNVRVQLEDTQISTDLAITNARETTLLSIQKGISAAKNVKITVQQIIDDNDLGDGYSQKDPEAKFFTIRILDTLEENIEGVESVYQKAHTSSSQADVATAAQEVTDLLGEVDALLRYAIDSIEGTLIVGQYTFADQEADVTTLINQQLQLDTIQIEVAQNKQAYDTALVQKPLELNTRQASVDAAQAALNTLKAQNKARLITAQSAISIAQAEYDLARSKATNAEIAIAQAQVTAAQATLQKFIDQRNDYVITAPFSGIVAKINFEKNETVTSADVVATVIGEGDYKIVVDIPESDIAKLAVNNITEVTLDAFGDAIPFQGEVVSIEPAETVIQDVVYFQVEVSIDPGEYEVKRGMTANVDIITEKRNDVLAVSQRAVLSDDEGRYVRILIDNEVVHSRVTTGLRADGGRIEILSGIEQGDEIVIFEKEL
jgi:RND family efflux transporter MFP subunit